VRRRAKRRARPTEPSSGHPGKNGKEKNEKACAASDAAMPNSKRRRLWKPPKRPASIEAFCRIANCRTESLNSQYLSRSTVLFSSAQLSHQCDSGRYIAITIVPDW